MGWQKMERTAANVCRVAAERVAASGNMLTGLAPVSSQKRPWASLRTPSVMGCGVTHGLTTSGNAFCGDAFQSMHHEEWYRTIHHQLISGCSMTTVDEQFWSRDTKADLGRTRGSHVTVLSGCN